MNAFSIALPTVIVLLLVVHGWLTRRHATCLRRHRDRVPEAFVRQVSLEEHRKAADYCTAKARFLYGELCFELAVVLFWTLGGGLQLLWQAGRGLPVPEWAVGGCFLGGFLFLQWLLGQPLKWQHTFGLEQRFGFNRMSPRLYLVDQLKSLAIGAVLGVALIGAALLAIEGARAVPGAHSAEQLLGRYWWLPAWALLFGFVLFMNWLGPTFIAPLFNRFKPLENDALRKRIEQLLERCGFAGKGIYVMDGSSRSAHGNAYFTGSGRNKRIVFFDTLIEQLEAEELEAVLAHELGHYRCGHLRQRLLIIGGVLLAVLWLLAWAVRRPAFFPGLGLPEVPATEASLVFLTGALLLLLGPVLLLCLQPCFSLISRRHEFQADDFAAAQAQAEPLRRALVKLYRHNANTLTPDPWYSAFHDSHPPPPLRLARLGRRAAAA